MELIRTRCMDMHRADEESLQLHMRSECERIKQSQV